jgi:hypothetical protein
MEVVLAEVEGRESRSSEDGDTARGMLSYDWSDMLAAYSFVRIVGERALIRCLSKQGRDVGVAAMS